MLNLRDKRIAVFAEGCFGPVTSKVATSYLRYRHSDCIAVIDSRLVGQDVGDILGYGRGIPVLDSLESALSLKPEMLLIGVGLFSNELPDSWRVQIALALRQGLDVVSGLHFRIATDPEFRALAAASGARIWDTKEPPEALATSRATIGNLGNFIVHTIGSDCRVGKKTTAIEITEAAKRRGFNAGFIATGQSGIYISGAGVAIDAVPADFVAGVTESLVFDAAKSHDWIVVEGQGSITHPAYSGVTLGLLHGAMPQALVLCHEAHHKHHKGWPNAPLRPLNELVALYEQLGSFLRPAKVVGVSVHCGALGRDQAARVIEQVEQETGLPATDVIQFGADKLVDALSTHSRHLQKLAA
ncbi:hypothetical protein EOS_30895 [Caballeronia mineralivorans PML1(12)]|uniref:EBNA-1 nuclear protein n=1 Tax=Caballeronia mineralivorans PML1(12) TaxID=908627 RepID=A0A0J1CP94_9BURK|nr:DUF1611 domain-containing protein [Caballeronia mineralivorans]KLU22429.1 hypothetical protein EOS_30895 [Caballeronia mineralivorans PML1(12)]